VLEDSEKALSLDCGVKCIGTALIEASKTQLTCGFCHYLFIGETSLRFSEYSSLRNLRLLRKLLGSSHVR
jgi:hypothetical protein